MSEREYKRLTQQLRPFITLFIVVVGSAFLASCGGGGNGSGDPTATVSSDDAPNVTAQAVSGGTVPAGWKGRAPTTEQRLITSDGGLPNPPLKLSTGQEIVSGQLLARIKDDVSIEAATNWIVSNGFSIEQTYSNGRMLLLRKPYQSEIEYNSIVEKIKATNYFRSVRGPMVGTANSTISDPILLTAQGKWNFDSINLPGAWDLLPESSVAIPRIGIFDGGFRRGHEDITFRSISTKFTNNAAQTPEYCSKSNSGAYLSPAACEHADHGMHVSGLIGANGNTFGSSGVVRYANGNIDAYKFVDNSTAEFADAIKKFGDRGIKIMNVSWGLKGSKLASQSKLTTSDVLDQYTTENELFEDSVAYLISKKYEMLLVQSAGNEFDPIKIVVDGVSVDIGPEYSGYAASYALDRLIDKSSYSYRQISDYVQSHALIVGSFYISADGKKTLTPGASRPPASQSNNFILAPGGYWAWTEKQGTYYSSSSHPITSTLYHKSYGSANSSDGLMVGTSMAAPHVTGVAALVLQANDKLSIPEVRDVILISADTNLGTPFKDRKDGDGSDGYRYLNAEAAVKEAIRRKAEVNCGSITSPKVVGQQGPLYSAIVGQATTFTAIATANPGYKFSTYQWKTSEGVDAGGPTPDMTFRFNAVGTVSVTVTPVLADGTVCTGSGATSSVTVTGLATTIFQDDFNGTALDLKKWTIQYFNGQPVGYSVSGGLLRLVNPGGSRGAAGETDGNMFIPNVSAVSGDFQVTIAVQEVARTQSGPYKDSSGFRLQFGNTNISLFGNYNGYWFDGPYNSYKGHRFQASDPNGNLCLLDDSLDLNTMYTAELRIRRSGGIGYVGYRLAGKTAWTEKPCSLMALAVPNFVIASGDGGGTSRNGSFTGNVDRFEISTDPVLSAVIQVEANAPQGTTITVPNGVTSCTFNASGSWNYGNGVSSSANGVVFDTSDYVRLLGTAPWFSLIAKTSTGYIPIGSSSALQVTPGQSLAFMINEGLRAGVNPYSDNSGALSLAYNCN